ncbi:L-threonylcarbamoyladenylate synthase [[Eubacterium] cellulosolvens]
MILLKSSVETLRIAAKIISEGGIIIYPTDTVYGLGCDPFNQIALKRILKIKKGRRKPFPILVATKKDAMNIVQWNDWAEKLTSRFWPGQLTIILKSLSVFPPEVTAGGDSLAVRVPNNMTTQGLLRLCQGLLIGTSANPSGLQPCTTAQDAAVTLGDQVDLIIDGGTATTTTPSTVIDLSNNFKIIREGVIAPALILETLGKDFKTSNN